MLMTKVRTISFFFFLFYFSANFLVQNCFAQRQISIPQFTTLDEKVKFYKELLKVDSLNNKITNNTGDGFDELYGTRNMRTILYGIAYRGGANNFYHKINKRANNNPLPEDGLQHLCNLGFTEAIYLYSKNFSTSKHLFYNKDSTHTLKYQMNTLNNKESLREVLEMVLERIKNPSLGPMYVHCWNGWHQAGYISAVILMQFCSFTNEEALKYWIANTDGNNKGYDNIKKKILDFVPFPDLKISKEIAKKICPCNNVKK
jgi:hypothetical protein